MSDADRPASPKAVFLSYTSDDLAVASAVCEALRDAGIEVWMDRGIKASRAHPEEVIGFLP